MASRSEGGEFSEESTFHITPYTLPMESGSGSARLMHPPMTVEVAPSSVGLQPAIVTSSGPTPIAGVGEGVGVDAEVSLSGSTSEASGKSKKRKRPAPRLEGEWPSKQASHFIQTLALEFFATQSKESLEGKYLSSGTFGIEKAREELNNLFFLRLASDDCWDRDRSCFRFRHWMEELVQQTLFNPMNMYVAVHKGAGNSSGTTSELEEKLKWWSKIASNLKKGNAREVPWVRAAQVSSMSLYGRQSILWVPRGAEVIPYAGETFQGGFAHVRKVRIEGHPQIPNTMQFAGKTPKIAIKRKARKQRSVEAMVCPIDHPGIVKFYACNATTMESYTPWWNGGSLHDMNRYDASQPQAMPAEEFLRGGGVDFGARQRLVWFRQQRPYLTWAFLNIMDIVHKNNLQHNDLSPSNILFHFPDNGEGKVYIGICDWGCASWKGEETGSNYGYQHLPELEGNKVRRPWVAPELFYQFGPHGGNSSPKRMKKSRPHTMKSEAFAVGVLATMILKDEFSGDLFKDSNDMMFFKEVLKSMSKENPTDRWTIAHAINRMKEKPFNWPSPNANYRYNIDS